MQSHVYHEMALAARSPFLKGCLRARPAGLCSPKDSSKAGTVPLCLQEHKPVPRSCLSKCPIASSQ